MTPARPPGRMLAGAARALRAQQRFDAIVIGGSAGSLEVLLQLMPALRPGLQASIFLVLHLPPDRTSLLASILAPRCALAVADAQDKQIPGAGHLYVAPPAYHLLIDHGPAMALSADEPVLFSRPSIDVLFESAADVYRHRLLAILLSGASADGAQGVAAALACGGTAIVQSPDSAAVPLMPESALRLSPRAAAMTPSQLAGFLGMLA